jgi:hypothetical protein
MTVMFIGNIGLTVNEVVLLTCLGPKTPTMGKVVSDNSTSF